MKWRVQSECQFKSMIAPIGNIDVDYEVNSDASANIMDKYQFRAEVGELRLNYDIVKTIQWELSVKESDNPEWK